ncbi:hypothetical protein ACD661_12265 [Legionella lytica]|uniref:Protein kinase domain-containing protein n=1 Tax=Legionella lytica TaxID=96232 RepID=A0ABW8D9D5_9GAMM
MPIKYIPLAENDIKLLSTVVLSPDEKKLLELALVIDFFNNNPENVKCCRGQIIHDIKLTQSYIRDSEGAIVIVEPSFLGRGAFGKVKDARSLLPRSEALAIKIVEIEDEEGLEALKVEALFNKDLGIARGRMLVRTNTERQGQGQKKVDKDLMEVGPVASTLPSNDVPSFGFEFITDSIYPCKVYQIMENKGSSLQKKIIEAREQFDQIEKNGGSDEKTAASAKLKALEMDFAIKISILISKLGTGALSSTGTPYAHRDLKPENFVVDKKGKIMVIDCGSMTSKVDVDELVSYTFKGTIQYAAIDVAELVKGGPIALRIQNGIASLYAQRDKGAFPAAPVLTNATLDRIAMLRTLWNPFDPDSKNALAIFHRRTFDAMPQELRNVLDTTHIMPHVDVDRHMETPLFFAAILIEYKEKNTISASRINEIRKSLVLQKQLVLNFEAKVNECIDDLTAAPLSKEITEEKTTDVDLLQTLRERVQETRIELIEKTSNSTDEENEMGLTGSFHFLPR